MNSLDKYILQQFLSPLAFILIVITTMVWMTQSLQRIDIIVEYGQGLGVFMLLSVLIIPSLLAVIIPFALFGACVYALHRLHSDSEIAVMFAAGVSRWRIAAPILLVTFIGAFATYYVNVDLMPRSFRIMKQLIVDIRSDFASALIRSGEFMALEDGFTIYVDDARPGGQFVGLLVNDYRDPEEPKTYMAERAVLRDADEGSMLFLRSGNIQRVSKETGEVNIIRFDELAVNITSLQGGGRQFDKEFTERFPHELLNPDMSVPYDRVNAGKLRAEGHARFAGPLYAFAFVFVGLFVMIGGSYSRRGYILRAAAGGLVIFALQLLAYIVQGLVAMSGAYWILYALPSGATALFAFLLFAPIGRRNRLKNNPVAEAV